MNTENDFVAGRHREVKKSIGLGSGLLQKHFIIEKVHKEGDVVDKKRCHVLVVDSFDTCAEVATALDGLPDGVGLTDDQLAGFDAARLNEGKPVTIAQLRPIFEAGATMYFLNRRDASAPGAKMVGHTYKTKGQGIVFVSDSEQSVYYGDFEVVDAKAAHVVVSFRDESVSGEFTVNIKYAWAFAHFVGTTEAASKALPAQVNLDGNVDPARTTIVASLFMASASVNGLPDSEARAVHRCTLSEPVRVDRYAWPVRQEAIQLETQTFSATKIWTAATLGVATVHAFPFGASRMRSRDGVSTLSVSRNLYRTRYENGFASRPVSPPPGG